MNKSSFSKRTVSFLGVVAALALLNGCGESKSGDHGHAHPDGHGHSHGDDHAPPHGGTPVVVAEDKFHLELVRDPAAGRMQAYVLDGHLEGYVQVSENNFLMTATAGGTSERLAFQRAPEPASGQVPMKSALFEAQAEWLKTNRQFAGHIPTITLGGSTFTNITFAFPKGTKHVH